MIWPGLICFGPKFALLVEILHGSEHAEVFCTQCSRSPRVWDLIQCFALDWSPLSLADRRSVTMPLKPHTQFGCISFRMEQEKCFQSVLGEADRQIATWTLLVRMLCSGLVRQEADRRASSSRGVWVWCRPTQGCRWFEDGSNIEKAIF